MNNNTQIINFLAGPGCGKSTSAALVFAHLKENTGLNIELVQEYVKQWAWEDKKPVNYDQFYLFGQQARREYQLFNKVNVIVTDSPVIISGYYAHVYSTPEQKTLFRHMTQVYYSMVQGSGIKVRNIFLNRVKAYNPNGRFENEEQARGIDLEMRSYVKSLGMTYEEVDGDHDSILAFADGLIK